MPTNDLSLAASYFAQEERSSLPESVDVAQLLGQLGQCRICYVICDSDHKIILHGKLYESMDEAKQNCADHLAIATAIVPA
ncbi:hypothetical protein [Rubinisphaera italica]|nr:hypothetical protein [Rubinisphaera italica]